MAHLVPCSMLIYNDKYEYIYINIYIYIHINIYTIFYEEWWVYVAMSNYHRISMVTPNKKDNTSNLSLFWWEFTLGFLLGGAIPTKCTYFYYMPVWMVEPFRDGSNRRRDEHPYSTVTQLFSRENQCTSLLTGWWRHEKTSYISL